MANVVVIKCACGKTAEYDSSIRGQTGLIKHQTGFKPYFDQGNGLTSHWACPECYKKAQELAQEIIKLLPADELFFGGLLR